MGWLVALSPYLTLDPGQVAVVVAEGSLVDAGAIADHARMFAGTPLARVSMSQLRRHAEAQQAVLQATARRSWPAGVTVDIESRQPVGAVAADEGFAWVDQTGVVVGYFADAGGHPRIHAPLDQPRVLVAVLDVWDVMPDALRQQVRHFSAETTDSVDSTLTSGQVVRWGGPEQLKLKAATVSALLENAPYFNFLDVSSPSLPITR